MLEPSLSEDVHVTEAIVNVLAEAGVAYVLGMPGGYTGPLFTALHEHPSIRGGAWLALPHEHRHRMA